MLLRRETKAIGIDIVLVRENPDGRVPALTPRLFTLEVGDRIALGEKIAGHFTLHAVQPTDDVVFLVPGRPPMDKAEFATLSRPAPGALAPQIDSHSEIQEITVSGDWAFMWTRLRVTVTPPQGGTAMQRAGHTLTVLRKDKGRWLLARDANLLAQVA